MEIKFKKLSKLAQIPKQHIPTDAGYDFFSTEDYILKP